MSYEGYTELLCERGHYGTIDAFDDAGAWQCPACGATAAYTCEVDQTNGYDRTDPRTYGGETTVTGEAVWCQCACGHKHIAGQPTYAPKGNRWHRRGL